PPNAGAPDSDGRGGARGQSARGAPGGGPRRLGGGRVARVRRLPTHHGAPGSGGVRSAAAPAFANSDDSRLASPAGMGDGAEGVVRRGVRVDASGTIDDRSGSGGGPRGHPVRAS